MVDRILLVHGLEHAGHAQAMLREAWRVLAADGRLLMVVPNRRGIWARLERTPFGAGRPYSARQIDRLLRSNMFTPLRTQGVLYFPPSPRPVFLKAAGAFEKVLPRFKVNAFAGALLIEASKQVYATSDRSAYVVKARRRRARVAVALGASSAVGVPGAPGRVAAAVLRPAQHEKALPTK
jgi:SAM-dependent methyltransferase